MVFLKYNKREMLDVEQAPFLRTERAHLIARCSKLAFISLNTILVFDLSDTQRHYGRYRETN